MFLINNLLFAYIYIQLYSIKWIRIINSQAKKHSLSIAKVTVRSFNPVYTDIDLSAQTIEFTQKFNRRNERRVLSILVLYTHLVVRWIPRRRTDVIGNGIVQKCCKKKKGEERERCVKSIAKKEGEGKKEKGREEKRNEGKSKRFFSINFRINFRSIDDRKFYSTTNF